MMKPLIPAGLCLAVLCSCSPTREGIDGVDALSDVTCSARPASCAYLGSPLKVGGDPITLPRRPYKFFRMTQPMRFDDARGREWTAPTGTLTDGASIPPVFVSIVGRPTAPEYVNAGAMHDAYCGVGNEGGPMYHSARWQDVHRMFYDGLVVSGTPPQRAKVMFAAVWLGGPRWNVHYDFAGVPAPVMQQAMSRTKAYIEREDPSFAQLQRYLAVLEKRLIRENAVYFPQLHGGGEDARGGFESPEPTPQPETPETGEEGFGEQDGTDIIIDGPGADL